MGRVPEVGRLIKTAGNNGIIYDSTGYPVDMKLSDLQLTNWTKGSLPSSADTISVWDSPLSKFDTYWQLADSTWRGVDTGPLDQSSFVLPAGTTVAYLKRQRVTGANSYLEPTLPYSF